MEREPGIRSSASPRAVEGILFDGSLSAEERDYWTLRCRQPRPSGFEVSELIRSGILEIDDIPKIVRMLDGMIETDVESHRL